MTLIWYPWSLVRFDLEMKMLNIIFSYVRSKTLEVQTLKHLYEALKQD